MYYDVRRPRTVSKGGREKGIQESVIGLKVITDQLCYAGVYLSFPRLILIVPYVPMYSVQRQDIVMYVVADVYAMCSISNMVGSGEEWGRGLSGRMEGGVS